MHSVSCVQCKSTQGNGRTLFERRCMCVCVCKLHRDTNLRLAQGDAKARDSGEDTCSVVINAKRAIDCHVANRLQCVQYVQHCQAKRAVGQYKPVCAASVILSVGETEFANLPLTSVVSCVSHCLVDRIEIIGRQVRAGNLQLSHPAAGAVTAVNENASLRLGTRHGDHFKMCSIR